MFTVWIESEFGLVCFDSIECLRSVFGPLRFFRFAVHLLKLCSDLQRRPILGLWDVEPHIQPTAETEKQKYEETKVVQMLLERKEDICVSASDAFDLISLSMCLLACSYYAKFV